MDLELPEDVKMLQTTMRKVVRDELMPLEPTIMEEEMKGASGNFPEELHKKLSNRAKELGIWQGMLPEELGGAGLSLLADMVIGEELAYTIVNFPTTGGLGAPIMLNAEPHVRDKYFPKLVSGELHDCFVQTEPTGGSDVAGIQTFAERKGDEYILNGRKTFISAADKADIGFVVAVTDKAKGTHGGISTFIVDCHQPGWKVVRPIQTMGGMMWRPFEVLLEDVHTPADHRIGEEGRGFAFASKFLSHGRIHMATSFVGLMRRSLDMSIDYAKKRVTFGEPLSNRQAVQWMLVDGAIGHHASQLMVYQAASAADDHPEADNRKETSMCRVFASENGLKTIDNAIQIHGGLGYSKDLPLELMWRRARIFTIGEGPNEIQRYIIARQMFRGN